MQQGLESQRVVPELSLVHWYSVRVMECSVLILELPLEPATPQDPRHQKPLQNSNAVPAEGDQCGHSAVANISSVSGNG